MSPRRTMTPDEFAKRFRARRYVQAKYRSVDTVPTQPVKLPSLHGTFTLSMILAASYPNLALITN
jgi:hypothetical protein